MKIQITEFERTMIIKHMPIRFRGDPMSKVSFEIGSGKMIVDDSITECPDEVKYLAKLRGVEVAELLQSIWKLEKIQMCSPTSLVSI